MVMEIVLLVIALFQIILSMVIAPNQNFSSALLFRVVPILSGLFIIFYALKQLGWIINI